MTLPRSARPAVAAALLGAVLSCEPASREAVTVPAVPDSLLAGGTPPRQAYDRLVYVPAYSHIWHVSADRDFQLTVTLSVRNPNPWSDLTINRIDYFDSEGDLARVYLAEPRRLGPLETMDVVVEERDETGGSGADFLVGWTPGDGPMAPVVEAVMIGTASGQGLSFLSVGRPVPPPDSVGATSRPAPGG